MWDPSRPVDPEFLRFGPAKCCTYVPSLPNFAVGQILLDSSPSLARGRGALAARMGAPGASSPLGVVRSRREAKQYEALVEANAFGQSPDVTCPFFAPGAGLNCTIWPHRNASCATWYCKLDRAAGGHRLWLRLRDLLWVIESSLARWCLLELGLEEGALTALFATDASGPREADLEDEATVRRVWGSWAGNEAGFYVACGRLVQTLEPARIAALGGVELRLAARLAQAAMSSLSAALPDPLRLASVGSVRLANEVRRVCSYSPCHPLELPAATLDALARFDGRPSSVVLKELAALGIQVAPELLRQLVDFEILVPAR